MLGDSLAPLTKIWAAILDDPDGLADAYAAIWAAQAGDPRGHFDAVRAQFNREQTPEALLYLIARCVKNAVRFNAAGGFNQSPDNRRRGMRPEVFRARARAAHRLLAGRARAVCADYSESLRAAGPQDVIYMDPPYIGVSGTHNPRYHQGIDLARFVEELAAADARGLSFLVSFDGRCGDRVYGALPPSLGLARLEVSNGRSAQATLSGRAEETVESLYLSPALLGRLG